MRDRGEMRGCRAKGCDDDNNNRRTHCILEELQTHTPRVCGQHSADKGCPLCSIASVNVSADTNTHLAN